MTTGPGQDRPVAQVRADRLRDGDVVVGYGRLVAVRVDGPVVTFLARDRDAVHANRASLHPVLPPPG